MAEKNSQQITDSLEKDKSANSFPDLSDLRLSQDFASEIGVRKILTMVNVRKPSPQEFVRVRYGDEWRLSTQILELKEDRENFIIDKNLWSDLYNEIVPKVLYTAINRHGNIFLWSVRLPSVDGRIDKWNHSAHDAVKIAESKWIRVTSNKSVGFYEVFEALGTLAEPDWPDITFNKLVELAFKDRFIKSLDHPILKGLRGEIV